jgi:hypothetical protein
MSYPCPPFWVHAVRSGQVHADPKRDTAPHRGEVYGQQYDDLSEDWWRECHDCGEITSYNTWDEAIYDAVSHYIIRNGAVAS